MNKYQNKPCRGCGGEKESGRERSHWCKKCEDFPDNRSVILDGLCPKGHSYRVGGYYFFSNANGYVLKCKECAKIRATFLRTDPVQVESNRISSRRSELMRNYGMTEDDWMLLYKFQNGKCPLCGKKLNLIWNHKGENKNASIDHDHVTGLVRGLLCKYPCNYSLGLLKDNLDFLRACINYLENPPSIEAFGKERYTLPGQIGTKKRTAALRKMRDTKGVK